MPDSLIELFPKVVSKGKKEVEKSQTKSKQRVLDHGEVFTAEREVNAMLDLVKQETERIDSRFLEPACGTGNFLAEILRRKLAVVKSRYGKNPDDYERYAVLAVTSIYGVDLLQDNVDECRIRMFDIFNKEYAAICGIWATDETREAVRHILKHNILCGDALTLKTSTGQPIAFAEWSAVNSCLLKRRDFRLDQMLEGREQQYTLEMIDWEFDNETKAYIPRPFQEFPLVHYKKVQQYE
ncbi:MAG: SAM-dependent methyltransferase [Spirochaetes bacterium]|nr:SAM-dependent methyltransferase [Spirochaetota bacterium]